MTSSLMWLMVVGALQKSALHLQTPASCPCRNINKDRSKLMENELKSAIIIRNMFHYFALSLIFPPGIGLSQQGQNLQRRRNGIYRCISERSYKNSLNIILYQYISDAVGVKASQLVPTRGFLAQTRHPYGEKLHHRVITKITQFPSSSPGRFQ